MALYWTFSTVKFVASQVVVFESALDQVLWAFEQDVICDIFIQQSILFRIHRYISAEVQGNSKGIFFLFQTIN